LNQFTEYRESKATSAGAVTSFVQWGGGLNNAQRNSVTWTGTEWFDCPNDYVSEFTVRDANGVSTSTYCKAYKTSSKAVVRAVAGLKMVDVVKEIRAYPLYDNAGKFSAWGPDPVANAAPLNAVFPAGAKAEYFTSQDLSSPDTYGPQSSSTVVAYNSGVANGLTADCAKLGTAANNVQYQVVTDTLEKMVAGFIGKPCVNTPSATIVADTGEPINEAWGLQTVDIGDVTDPYTNATGFYRSGVKRLRVSFAAGNVVNYWACLLRTTDGSTRNCVAAGTGSYTIETIGDARVMRLNGVPANAANQQTFSRIFVERAGKVQYGSRGKLAFINSIRLNKEATDTLFVALGVPVR
jgi:trimeric autotransporter adhesin